MNLIDILEEHYNDLSLIGYAIPVSWFNKDVEKVLCNIFYENQLEYKKLCSLNGNSYDELDKIFVQKDEDENCFLVIYGNDNKSVLIVRKDDSCYFCYKEYKGLKITESEFTNFFQNKTSLISQTNNVINYLNYLKKDCLKYITKEVHVINQTKDSYRVRVSKKYDEIDYTVRQNVLLGYDPFKIITLYDYYTNEQIDCYLFLRNEKIVVVLEPIANHYTKVLYVDDKDKVLEKIIAAAENDNTLNNNLVRIGNSNIESYLDDVDLLLKTEHHKHFKRGRIYQL